MLFFLLFQPSVKHCLEYILQVNSPDFERASFYPKSEAIEPGFHLCDKHKHKHQRKHKYNRVGTGMK